MRKNNRNRRRKQLRHERLEMRAMLTASPWTNPLNPLDVTGDGQVSSRDALNIVNRLSIVAEAGTNKLTDLFAPPILGQTGDGVVSRHYDTTGEGELSARDALVIVNRLGQENPLTEPIDVPEQGETLDQSAHDLALVEDYVMERGELDDTDDRDVFRFRPSRSRVTVDLSAIEDESLANIRVLDSSQNEITRGSQRRGRDRFEGFDFQADVGNEYFVVVEGDVEVNNYFYTIEVYQYEPEQWTLPSDSNAGDDVHGDDIDAATLLNLQEGSVRVSSHIDPGDDLDVFQIVASENRVSFEVLGLTPTNFATNLRVTDASGEVLPPINQLGGAYTVAVEPGTSLYATISSVGNQTGQYIFDVHEFQQVADSADQDGDTLEEATLLVPGDGIEIFRTIDSSDDVDVFKFKTPSANKKSFVSVGGYGQFADVEFEVLDRAGNVVEAEPSGFDPIRFAGIYPVLSDEEYFIRVSGANGVTGEYILTLGLIEGSFGTGSSPDSELGNDIHSDQFTEATLLEGGETQRISNIDTPGDVDVFRYPVRSNTALVALTGASLSLSVFDPDLNPITPFNSVTRNGALLGGSFDVEGLSHLFIRAEGLVAGEYILEVAESDVDDRTPPIDVEPDSELGDDPHGDSFAGATELEVDNSRTGRFTYIDATDDVDLFRIPLSETAFTVEALGPHVTLEVFDQDQNLLSPCRR